MGVDQYALASTMRARSSDITPTSAVYTPSFIAMVHLIGKSPLHLTRCRNTFFTADGLALDPRVPITPKCQVFFEVSFASLLVECFCLFK
jgi:hypothetical protein